MHVLQFRLKKALPRVWEDIFGTWFENHNINKDCTSTNNKGDILNTLFCFNDASIKYNSSYLPSAIEYLTYECLADNGITTLYDVLKYYSCIITVPRILPSNVHNYVTDKRNRLSESWMEIIHREEGLNNYSIPPHWVECCRTGNFSAKLFYRWLIRNKYCVNDRALVSWRIDLDITGIREKWESICKRYMVIKNPSQQDLARSFLQRAYYTNIQLSTFMPISDKCTFCKQDTETWIHLFWECPVVQLIWERVIHLLEEYLVIEGITQEHCMLSNHETDVIVIITTVVKLTVVGQ